MRTGLRVAPRPMRDRPTDEIEPESRSDADLLKHYDILRLRAPNPGPLTLSGTNTWVVGRRPAWVVDPGPLIEAHHGAPVRGDRERAAGSAASCSRTTTRTTPKSVRAAARALSRRRWRGGRGAVDVSSRRACASGRFEPGGHLRALGRSFRADRRRRLLHRRRGARRRQRLHRPPPRRDVPLPARADAPAHARGLQRALPRPRPDRVGRPRTSSKSTSTIASTASTR